MAKKEQKKSGSTNRFPFLGVFIIFFGLGVAWIWQSDLGTNWKEDIIHYIDNRDIATLEARFSPEQTLQLNRQEILGTTDKISKRVLQNTSLIYYPYLLMNVKYTTDQHSREGMLLWGLNDGEIVLNTQTCETTHGFRDCLECGATRQDLKVLQSLAKSPSGMSIEQLQKEMGVEKEELVSWTENAKQKHLIVQKGNHYHLHFENPKLLVIPQTQMTHPIVLKQQGSNQKAPRHFNKNQIVALSKAAFGSDFKIRSEEEIYLPVYRFEVLNPDESIQMSEWNALTGHRLVEHQIYLSPNR